MKSIEIKRLTVRKLWRLCDEGVFAVPEIQREFVWDPRRASDLLDSLVRHLPIGSLLVWKTTSQRKHLLRHAQEILPPHDFQNKDIWFLIDGQQRLAVLYRAKHGQTVTNDSGRRLDFSKLCLSFDDQHDTHFAFVRRPLPKQHIPLVTILASNWKRKLRHLSKARVAEVETIRARIQRYIVPVIFVDTNKVEEIREAFLRINSAGLRISKADRAFTKASRLDLRRLVKELRETLPYGFDEINPRTLQVAMAVIMGQRETSSKAVESVIARLEREEIEDGKVSAKFTREWRKISNSVKKAVDYLTSELGVLNLSFLPSEPMLPILAFFFHCNNSAQPNAKQRAEIRKWFWATAVGGRYVGRGYYDNIRRDLEFFQRLGRRRKGRFVPQERIPSDNIRRADYQGSGSLGKAFFLLLAHRKPRYLESGNIFPLDRTAASANRKDKHHIFPKALLTRNGFSRRETNSLCNMCYLVAEENQSIGSNKPCRYLEEYRGKRHFASVMKSHLIPYRSDASLWRSSVRPAYKQFQKQRLDLVRKSFNKAAGLSLFRND